MYIYIYVHIIVSNYFYSYFLRILILSVLVITSEDATAVLNNFGRPVRAVADLKKLFSTHLILLKYLILTFVNSRAIWSFRCFFHTVRWTKLFIFFASIDYKFGRYSRFNSLRYCNNKMIFHFRNENYRCYYFILNLPFGDLAGGGGGRSKLFVRSEKTLLESKLYVAFKSFLLEAIGCRRFS
jgi:hypothetical protein